VDTFLEKIVPRKKNILDYLFMVIVIMVNIPLFYLTFSIGFLSYVIPLIIPCIIYLDYILITMRNVEYEYIITNSDLDIDTIINKKKRKRLLSVNIKDFELVASTSSDKITTEMRNIKNVIHTESSPTAEDLYFVVLTYNKKRTILIMEPGEKMLNAMHAVAPRKVFI
jgi:Holliday junction resolvasome RuvABC ATP-dependent DNA helicase subunit